MPLSQGVGCSRPTAVPLRARQLSESIKNQSNDTANINYSRETRNGIDLEGAALLLVIEMLCGGGEGPGLGGRGHAADQSLPPNIGLTAGEWRLLGGPAGGQGPGSSVWPCSPLVFWPKGTLQRGGAPSRKPGWGEPSRTPQLSLLC